jgi:putative DNA primase/helicase
MSCLADRCRRRWPSILPALGIRLPDKMLLSHRNGSCPICGGTDRFQFTDKEVGRWHCRGCGEGGDGIRLVERVFGINFLEAATRIEGIVGGGSIPQEPVIIIPTREEPAPVSDTDKPLQPWREAVPIRQTAVERYLVGRGLTLDDAEAASLRLHPQLWHWPTQMRMLAMVALVALHDGTELCAHATFLARNGLGKAEVEWPKLFPKDSHPVGGGVWFGRAEAGREFVVAEGIESALSAMRLSGAPSGVAAMSAIGLERLVLPSEARRVRIFADRDVDGKGLRAALAARRRWQGEGRTVAVKVAAVVGEDANDVLRRRLGI